MKNIFINIIKILAGVFIVASCGMIAAHTIWLGVAAICWLGVALGAWHMFDGIKSVLKK